MQVLYLFREDLLTTEWIAEGVEFSDGTVVIRWLRYPYSIAIYHRIEDIQQDIQGCLHILKQECNDGNGNQPYLASLHASE